MWHLLGFRRQPPVRQTSANVLAEIDPDVLEAVLLEFVEQLQLPEKIEVGTWHGERRTEQVLVRLQHALVKVLSNTAIPPETNESKTAYDLVRRLVLKEKLIVGDAAYRQREICAEVVTKEGDYLDWPGAKQLIRLERHTVEKGQARRSTSYAITSLREPGLMPRSR
jgi:hypothetical protein